MCLPLLPRVESETTIVIVDCGNGHRQRLACSTHLYYQFHCDVCYLYELERLAPLDVLVKGPTPLAVKAAVILAHAPPPAADEA